MANEIKCKNCGAPIELIPEPKGVVAAKYFNKPYWVHIRGVKMGRLWCYPKTDQELQAFKLAAEPQE